MNETNRKRLLLSVALVLIIGLTACGGSNPVANTVVPLTEQQVTSIVENMLTGYNTGDYAAFSRDMTAAMKTVISEEVFQEFVNESLATLGQFQSITSIEQSESGDTSTDWVVTAQFEKNTLEFKVTFNKATGQIEGMDFGPAG